MDLELLQDLSKFNLPAPIKIRSKTSKAKNEEGDDEDVLSCSTPTSQENKIPSVVDSPPPAPRKPRVPPSAPSATASRMIRSSCKRKLIVSTCEIVMNREEIDRFFYSVYNETSTTAKRRRSFPFCAPR